MIRRTLITSLMLLLLLPGQALAAQAKLTVGGEGGWTVFADRISGSQKTGIIEADGNVKLVRGEDKLEADYIKLNEKTSIAEIKGNVVFTSPEFRLTSKKFVLNLKDNTGKIYNGTIFFPSNNYYISGDEIERTGPDTFRLAKGKITTCDGDNPAWSLTAKNITVKSEGYATATHAALFLKQFPVFYTPIMIVPVKTNRQSGFLTPEIKSSNRNGVSLTVPYFWATSDSNDMTFSVTNMTERGINVGLEFRHMDWGGKGTYKIDFLNDNNPPNINYPGQDAFTDSQRYWIRGMSNFTTENGFEIKVDLDLVRDSKLLSEFERAPFGFNRTNEQFYQEFGRELPEPRDPRRKTTFMLSKYIRPMQLDMAIQYTRDLESETNNRSLQRLPHLNLDLPRTPIQGTRLPLFFQMDSEYTFFTRTEGHRGHRWDVHPRLHLPFKLFGWMDIDPSIGLRETVYLPEDMGDSSLESKVLARTIYDLEMELSTRLYKTYDINRAGLEKIKHRLKPVVSYRLISAQNQDHFPIFDHNDRVENMEIIEYGIVNDFIAKIPAKNKVATNGQNGEAFEYFEFIRLSLLSSYDLAAAKSKAAGRPYEGDVIGPWTVNYALYFMPYFRAEGASIFDTATNEFTQHDLELTIGDKRGDQVSVSYYYNEDNFEEIRYRFVLSLTKRLRLDYETRYSIDQDLNIETIMGVSYEGQCWAIRVEYLKRATESSIAVAFTLNGLGELSSYTFKSGQTY